jgi:hypothetical protein
MTLHQNKSIETASARFDALEQRFLAELSDDPEKTAMLALAVIAVCRPAWGEAYPPGELIPARVKLLQVLRWGAPSIRLGDATAETFVVFLSGPEQARRAQQAQQALLHAASEPALANREANQNIAVQAAFNAVIGNARRLGCPVVEPRTLN